LFQIVKIHVYISLGILYYIISIKIQNVHTLLVLTFFVWGEGKEGKLCENNLPPFEVVLNLKKKKIKIIYFLGSFQSFVYIVFQFITHYIIQLLYSLCKFICSVGIQQTPRSVMYELRHPNDHLVEEKQRRRARVQRVRSILQTA